jgi:hypothetical protein
MLVVIGTDCIYSCKSNNNAITTTTTPLRLVEILSSNYITLNKLSRDRQYNQIYFTRYDTFCCSCKGKLNGMKKVA